MLDVSKAGSDPRIAAALIIRVAGGHRESSNNRVYSPQEIDWAWKQIENSRAIVFKSYEKMIRNRRGESKLQTAIQPGYPAQIPTGRLRNDCLYTASRNWPFQALAADGAKLALYDLTQAGFSVVAFIHDEVLIEVPSCEDYRKVCDEISEIMIQAMRVICPDVEIRTESVVMKRWSKDAGAVYDAEGRLRVWEDDLKLAG